MIWLWVSSKTTYIDFFLPKRLVILLFCILLITMYFTYYYYFIITIYFIIIITYYYYYVFYSNGWPCMITTIPLQIKLKLFSISLLKGCFIMSYVLLFEIILSSKSRNTYCTLFIASQFFWNIFISIASKFFQDWRYMQLTGSLLASLAVGYPWLIKESFKWLIVRDDFSQAERVCKKIFKERNVVARLMKMKLDDQTVGDERNSEGYWPYVIWQPTFRKIISSFVLIWSVVSLVGFFVNEESKKLLANNLNDYSLQNGILFVSNLALCLLYYCK